MSFETPMKQSGMKSESETTSESFPTPPKAIPKFPSGIAQSKFDCYGRQEQTTDGLYLVVAEGISRFEFDEFVKENCETEAQFMWRGGRILMYLYYDCNRESPIHNLTTSFFAVLVDHYRARLGGDRLITYTGSTAQDTPELIRQPDFGIISRSRLGGMRRIVNIVGEVLYSQSLSSGHELAQSYLSPDSDISAVILVDLQFPWPRGANGRVTLHGTMTFFYYERQNAEHHAGNNIAPIEVISFGTAPLFQDDVDRIQEIVGCAPGVVRGHGVNGGPPCDGENPGFVVNIPGSVLLNTHPNDVAITIGGQVYQVADVPQQYDMQIDLFELQGSAMDGLALM
jgi:hypothetical protein